MYVYIYRLPRWLRGKESACQGRRHRFNSWGRKIPWRRKWQLTPVFLPREIPWTAEPGGLQSIGSQKVRHGLATEHEHIYITYIGLPWWLSGKGSTCSTGDLGLIPGLGRSPGGGRGNPLQYSYLENPCGQRSLVGYSPWGHKESDTTERLTLNISCGDWFWH